ncbi:cysteine synthase A [Clostridium pasteurianum]|uniref:Cysteine synthase n=1 Tax=Clostridium pasteurianum BC1 TaxID=86416 RepID=R4JZ59_CLOPA|nr:cysteine synthase A [Clostridium pasteurianum]AGK95583.1 cysteine synthase A [Clostridium pasteurianum BC1]
MSKIAKNLTELIGNTPLLELSNYNRVKNIGAKIIAKLEYFNPGGSVKDRIGLSMIKEAENKGIINKNTVIIEATSGNAGIALALVAAAKGYRLIITLPENFSIERRKLLKALGSELVLTSAEEGMNGAVKKAEELSMEMSNSYMPQQFQNPENPEIHRRTTAEEIWKDTDGNVDILVAGVGTGGTITGIGEVLKQKNPNIKIVAVEPYDSPVLSGGNRGAHKLQGLGPGFIPDVLNLSVIDEIITVKTNEAYETCRILGKTEGLLVGISSGAAVFSAAKLAKMPENKDKTIVVICPDTGERYLSTELFNQL